MSCLASSFRAFASSPPAILTLHSPLIHAKTLANSTFKLHLTLLAARAYCLHCRSSARGCRRKFQGTDLSCPSIPHCNSPLTLCATPLPPSRRPHSFCTTRRPHICIPHPYARFSSRS